MEQKFYICKHCGNIVAFVKESGAPVSCCGEIMQRLEAGVTDAAKEKHVPMVRANGNLVTVSVGSVTHPMEEKHYIEWISLQTKQGEKPEVTFALAEGDEVEAAYAYCNLHGLWKA